MTDDTLPSERNPPAAPPEPALPWSERAYLLLCATAVGMPTGAVFGLNVKWGLLAVVGAFLVLEGGVRLGPGRARPAAGGAAAALAAVALATYALFRGNEPEQLFGQLKEFLAVAWIVSLGLVIFRRADADADRVTDALLAGAGIFSAAKVVAAAAVVLGAVAFEDVAALALAVFGQTAAGLEFEGSLVRIQMGNDFAMPFVFYLALARGRVGTWLRRAAVVALLLGAIVSLSRFVWFATAVALLAAWVRVLRGRFWISTAAVIVLAAGVAWAATATDVGQATIEARFRSEASSGGDDIRDEQRHVLLAEHERYPLLGKGMGGWADRLVRNEDALYSYENQWVALLMQVGLVGLALLLLFPAAIVVRLLRARPPVEAVTDALLVGVFLLQGFFNPNLTSSTSGALLVVFMLLGRPRDADLAT